MSDNCPILTWQEPDFINVLGLCREDSGFATENFEKLEEQIRAFLRAFGNELFNREVLYYRHLLKSDISDNDFDRIIANLAHFDESYLISEKVGRPPKSSRKEGFAVLDSRTERFYITKACSVIGREPPAGLTGVTWLVDIPVKNTKKCSKQQALVLYNFETNKFEIKCISARISMEVDGRSLTADDAPRPLENGSVFDISGESFYFYLAKASSGR